MKRIRTALVDVAELVPVVDVVFASVLVVLAPALAVLVVVPDC